MGTEVVYFGPFFDRTEQAEGQSVENSKRVGNSTGGRRLVFLSPNDSSPLVNG